MSGTLAAGANVEVTVGFSPPLGLPYSTSVDFTSAGGPAAVALTGTGIAPQAFLSFDVAFGDVPVGSSATVSVAFTPGDVGARAATLTFATGSGNLDLVLTGTGEAAVKTLSTSTTEVIFPSTSIGTEVIDNSVLLKNLGNAAVSLQAAVISGPDASDFIFEEGPVTLPPLYGMSVAVAVRPSAVGQRTATMFIASDGGNVTVALSGMGSAPPPIALSGSKSALVFPATVVATASAPMTFSLSNSGDVPFPFPEIGARGFLLLAPVPPP